MACAVLIGASDRPSAQSADGPLDLDPLRHYVPDDHIYMPVPGGVYALTDIPPGFETIEDQRSQRNGGLIIGYCLRSSCRYISHLVVVQVCSAQIDGPDGTDSLVLAVVRLPYGKKPGFLKSLQGRDYAYNFHHFGPHEQVLPLGNVDSKVEALYALAADGVGPIKPLDFQGQQPKQPQSSETVALHLTMFPNDQGYPAPYFQVRHLCQQPIT
jgi:hypothetical protein